MEPPRTRSRATKRSACENARWCERSPRATTEPIDGALAGSGMRTSAEPTDPAGSGPRQAIGGREPKLLEGQYHVHRGAHRQRGECSHVLLEEEAVGARDRPPDAALERSLRVIELTIGDRVTAEGALHVSGHGRADVADVPAQLAESKAQVKVLRVEAV